MKFKKIAAAVLAAAVLAATPAAVTRFSPLSVTANAADTLTEGDYEYSVNEDGETVTITKYTGSDAEVDIPATLGGKTVTAIGTYAFSNCKSLTSVTIPDSVTTMSVGAFFHCGSLTSVTIPDGVTTINYWTFESCKSLTSVTIPDSVTTIDTSAFLDCTKLKTVYYGGTKAEWEAIEIGGSNSYLTNAEIICTDGIISGDLTYTVLEDGTLEVTGFASDDLKETVEELIIPEEVNGKKVTSISFAAFNRASITSVTIPDGMTTIDRFAFQNCTSLTSVALPNGVKTIDEFAFLYCESLETVNYSGTMAEWKAIKIYTNEELSTAEIICTDGIINERKELQPGDTFVDGDLEYKVLEDGTLEVTGFASDDLKETVKELIIPEEVKGKKVTSIGKQAFYKCESITSITIPDSVTTIGEFAFTLCTSLTSVTIPDSVTTIGKGAFTLCLSLTGVTVSEDNKNYSSVDGVLFNKNKTTILCYPAGKKNASYEIPNSVTSIGDNVFSLCTLLSSVTIPDSVTSIGSSAFRFCTSLTSVIIPDSVTAIGDDAFYNCESLTSVTIPDSVTTIGQNTFIHCASLTNVVIPDSVTTIGNKAFDSCTSLKSITIPDSVTTIGDGAFNDCTSLDTVYYGGSKADWEAIVIGEGNECLTNANIIFTEPATSEPDTSDPTESDTSEPATSDPTDPETSDTSEPTTSDTSEPTTSDTSAPTTSDPTDPDIYDEKYDITTDVEPSPDASGIPDDERIKVVTINAANWINKGAINLDEVKVKVREIYDEEGIKRAEEALGKTLNGNKYNLLDLTLLYNGEDYSDKYDGLIQVRFKIPNGHKNKTISCYRITEVDGKLVKELIPGTQTDDYYIIYLEHFSLYALVTNANPDNGEEEPNEPDEPANDPETPNKPVPGDTDANNGGGNGNGSGSNTDQADTGIALAIAPVVLAATAAIVVSKKKKK